MELTTKPAMLKNLDQIVTDSKKKVVKKKNKHTAEKEVVKKKNKYTAKKKEQLAKFCAFVESLLFLCLKFFPYLSPCFIPIFVPAFMLASIPALMPTLVPAPVFYLGCSTVLLFCCLPTFISRLRSLNVLSFCCVLIPVFCPGSSTILLFCYMFTLDAWLRSRNILSFCYMPILISYPRSLAILLSRCVPIPAVSTGFSFFCHTPISCCRILNFLLLFPILSPPLLLGFSLLRIFKQFLSDEP